MALDTTRVRRRLPQPPTDGSPGMDAPEVSAPDRPAAPTHQEAQGRPKPVGDDARLMDGRSLRATGRTTQLNLKVSDHTKRRFLALARERGVMLVDLFEQAIEALEAEDGIAAAGEEEDE